MQVKILKESGYDLALRGMSYSYFDRANNVDEWWDKQKEKAPKRSVLLSTMGASHAKFLRQIQLWVDIEAARCWWSEFDQYKVGVVTNSASTMHKLAKREPILEDFEEGTNENTVVEFLKVWLESKDDINILKMNLPEGYLQRRMVTMNYQNLRNIIEQRAGHRLKWWQYFIDEIQMQVEHPELLK
jgi:hypothetical protein